MTTFAARWVPIARRHEWLGRTTYRAVCGVPAGCPGVLGEWTPSAPDRVTPENVPLPYPRAYYVKDGDNRYRLPRARQRPRGWRRPGSRPDPRPVLIAAPGPVIRGRQPAIPTTIVCPVCGRDNAIALAPASR